MKTREAAIVQFFRTAPIALATTMYGIVRHEIQQRTKGTRPVAKKANKGGRPKGSKNRPKLVVDPIGIALSA